MASHMQVANMYVALCSKQVIVFWDGNKMCMLFGLLAVVAFEFKNAYS